MEFVHKWYNNKYTCNVNKYTCNVNKYTCNVNKYTCNVNKYTCTTNRFACNVKWVSIIWSSYMCGVSGGHYLGITNCVKQVGII